jgi:hypothetical protein
MRQFVPTPSQSSLLSKLPREVRDIIYDHLWQGTKRIEQRYKSDTYTVTYDMACLPLERVIPAQRAAWLLTNKQIMDEGMYQLHQKSTWHVHFLGPPAKSYNYIFPLNVPPRAAAQHLHLESHVNFDFTRYRSGTIFLRPSVSKLVKRMIETNGLVSSVKTLHVTLQHPQTRLDDVASWQKFDFSGLDVLVQHGQLQEVRIRLMFFKSPVLPRFAPLPSQAQDDSIVWTLLAPELSRIGRLLVPDGNEETAASSLKLRSQGNHIIKDAVPKAFTDINVWGFAIRK